MNINKYEGKMRVYPFSKIGDATLHLEKIIKFTDEDKQESQNIMTWLMHNHNKVSAGRFIDLDAEMKRRAEVLEKLWANDQLPYMNSYNIINDNKKIGRVMTKDRKYRGENLGGSGLQLDVIYVKPQYRGWGIATRVYKLCQELGFNQISLQFNKINTIQKIDYWQKIGYKSVRIVPGEDGTDDCLVVLDSNAPKGYALPLTMRGVAEARKHSHKIRIKFAKNNVYKEMGTQDFPYYEQHQDLYRSIVDNHFQSKVFVQKQLEVA